MTGDEEYMAKLGQLQSHVRAIRQIDSEDETLGRMVDGLDGTVQFLKRLKETGVDTADREAVMEVLAEIPEPAYSKCLAVLERVWAEASVS